MTKRDYITVFAALGERLGGFGDDERTECIIREAIAENPWFTRTDIISAVAALRDYMLSEGIVAEWLTRYDLVYGTPKRVAIILAGNIPLVGFSDLMCVLASGNTPVVKTSSKDGVLMRYVMQLLGEIAPELVINEYNPKGEYHAVIATGSDNTGRYFRSEFAGVPTLIRGSRGSVAVLRGSETVEELQLLSRDIFSYSGLGCRNVSILFVPEEYDLNYFGRVVARPVAKLNRKYYNNYLSTKGKLAASGMQFTDCGSCVITQGDTFPVSLSNLIAFRYSDVDFVATWLGANDDKIQCVVGGEGLHPRWVAFGESQHPSPWDYPDGVDVMSFLSAL